MIVRFALSAKAALGAVLGVVLLFSVFLFRTFWNTSSIRRPESLEECRKPTRHGGDMPGSTEARTFRGESSASGWWIKFSPCSFSGATFGPGVSRPCKVSKDTEMMR